MTIRTRLDKLERQLAGLLDGRPVIVLVDDDGVVIHPATGGVRDRADLEARYLSLMTSERWQHFSFFQV